LWVDNLAFLHKVYQKTTNSRPGKNLIKNCVNLSDAIAEALSKNTVSESIEEESVLKVTSEFINNHY